MKTEFKKYRRSQVAELRPVEQSDIDHFSHQYDERLPAFMEWNVSVSNEDLKSGSPKIGDMIARNPKNHNDQWLIAEQYFKDNFEDADSTPVPEQLLPIIEKVFGPGAAKGCAERLRQIQIEGWTSENDDQYDGGELAKASASYILPEESRSMVQCAWRKIVPLFFPRWNLAWWKPTPNNRIRELEKGIALGMAEIDRLKRKEEKK